MKRLLTGIMLAITLTVGLAPAAHADDEMGDAKAGKYYLKVVCPMNAAEDRFSDAIFGSRNGIPLAEAKRRLPELRRLSATLSRAESKAARQFFNPRSAWPDDVAKLVDRYATGRARLASLLARMGYATSAAEWGSLIDRAPDPGALPTQIRARLGLPPVGKGC
jgi:hypothetical protein